MLFLPILKDVFWKDDCWLTLRPSHWFRHYQPLVKGCRHSQSLMAPHSCCRISVRLIVETKPPYGWLLGVHTSCGSVASQLMMTVPYVPRLPPCVLERLSSASTPVTVLLRVDSRGPGAATFMLYWLLGHVICFPLFLPIKLGIGKCRELLVYNRAVFQS